MGRDVREIRSTVAIWGYALTIVANCKKVSTAIAPARDCHVARLRVDAVFNELSNRFQWAALRQCDDGNGVPVITDSQFAARLARLFLRSSSRHIGQHAGRSFHTGC